MLFFRFSILAVTAVSILILLSSIQANAFSNNPIHAALRVLTHLPSVTNASIDAASSTPIRASPSLASDSRVTQVSSRQAASNTATLTRYLTKNCDLGSVLSSDQLPIATCTSASALTSFNGPQSMNYMTVFCQADGGVTVFGYTDSSCNEIDSSFKTPSDGYCRGFFNIKCPTPSTTTPNAPSFPPSGHVVVSDCDGADCRLNCGQSTYPPNVCRTNRDPLDPAVTSSKLVCSSNGEGVSIQSFSDATCTGSTLFAASVIAPSACFNYNPSTRISCPIGAPTDTLPSFPPPNSVVTLLNCTDAQCSVDCAMKTTLAIGSCRRLNPRFSASLGFGSAAFGYSIFCLPSSRMPLVFYSESTCAASTSLYGLTANELSACAKDGSTYTQSSCTYSETQPQLPTQVLNIKMEYYTNPTCIAPSVLTFFARSNVCISDSFKIDCNIDRTTPTLSVHPHAGCTGVPTFESVAQGQCASAIRVPVTITCPMPPAVVPGQSHAFSRASVSPFVTVRLLSVLVVVFIAAKM